jgi:pyruvate/2-oxoglutarate/acetoin dehydrogenase E1 component
MDISFVRYINKKIIDQFSNYEDSVIYGQNIVAGSRISGLGAGLDEIKGVQAINTTNAENSLMGFGLGLAISGVPSLFLMKQHDFALLGIDQLTNTTNVLRSGRLLAPFVVLMVVVDSGYEGPQASLSSLDEFSSLTRVPVNFLSTKETIDLAFKNAELPGLHLMALSQKNLKKQINNSLVVTKEFEEAILYKKNKSKIEASCIAVIFFGVEISFIESVIRKINGDECPVDLWVISKLSKQNERSHLVSEFLKYNKIVIIDTGKSEIHYSSELAWLLREKGGKIHKFQRESSAIWAEVSAEELEFSADEVVELIEKYNKDSN